MAALRRFQLPGTLRAALLAGAMVGALAACSPTKEQPESAAPAGDASSAAATAPAEGPLVANFILKDHRGLPHELYAHDDKAAIVLATTGVGCPIVQKMTPALRDISAEYAAKNVAFLLFNSNAHDTPDMIAAEAEKFGLELPVLKDEGQALGRALKVERTAEFFVIDPRTWKVIYHGPMDDRLSYGTERPAPTNAYLRNVLDEVLAGRTPAFQELPASGCIINFESA